MKPDTLIGRTSMHCLLLRLKLLVPSLCPLDRKGRNFYGRDFIGLFPIVSPPKIAPGLLQTLNKIFVEYLSMVTFTSPGEKHLDMT